MYKSFVHIFVSEVVLNSLDFNELVMDGSEISNTDIKNHYLQSPIKNYQYMKMRLKYFTPEICTEYDVHNLSRNGYVRIEIRKVMNG